MLSLLGNKIISPQNWKDWKIGKILNFLKDEMNAQRNLIHKLN